MSLFRKVSKSFNSLRSSRSSRSSIPTQFSVSSTSTNGSDSNSAIQLTSTAEVNQVLYKEKKEIFVMASIKAPLFEKKTEDKRAPIDLCCVIDKSGSMAGEKLSLVKESMKFVIDNMDSNDRLSVVLYDTEVETLFDFRVMDSSQKEKSKKLVESITQGSSTNLYGGLERGLQLSSKRKSPNDICSVLLFTDGLANQGPFQQSAPICSETKKILEKMDKKCTVFTFGFGSDHDEDMLRNIAETGNGMYYFVAKPDSIPLSFADCLGGLQSIVAQNLSLNLKASEGVQITKSLNPKYQIKGALPGQNITLDLSDIYSEESRDIIFSITLPELKQPESEFELIKFELTFFNTITIQDESCHSTLFINRPEEIKNLEIDYNLDKQRNRLKAAEAMEESRKLAESGNYKEAQELLERNVKEIQVSASKEDDYCLKLTTEIQQCMDDVQNHDVYMSKGSKNISRKAQAHYYQRSNKIEDEDVGFYENSYKISSKMKSKALFS